MRRAPILNLLLVTAFVMLAACARPAQPGAATNAPKSNWGRADHDRGMHDDHRM